MDQRQVSVSIYTHFSDIRIIPLVVRYHPPISDAGVSVGFTGGTFWVHDFRIMRGLSRVPQMVRPPVASGSSHTGEHPYLRRMTFRGGGYAILRALWDAEKSDDYCGDLF